MHRFSGIDAGVNSPVDAMMSGVHRSTGTVDGIILRGRGAMGSVFVEGSFLFETRVRALLSRGSG